MVGGKEAAVETYRYPVELVRDDNETFLVTFPDFPEAHTFGDTKEDALVRGVDALATVIDAYISDRRDIPSPSAIKKWAVALPALMVAKVGLYASMRQQKVGKAELARRLHWHLPQVDRLLEVHHGSRLDQLEAAFSAIGKRIVISVTDEQASKESTAGGRQPKRAARARKQTASHVR